MMSPLVLYEDFGSDKNETLTPKQLEKELDALEDAKLVSFETGYQAGWDDAIKAQESLGNSVSTSLANNLQDASFQYHEVRAQLLRTVEDLMKAMVTTCLPSMAQQSLGYHICELIQAQAQEGVAGEIELVVHPEAVSNVKSALEHVLDRYSLNPNDALAPDEAQIRFARAEHSIDMGAVISEVEAAVTDYFEAQSKDVDHV